MAEEELAVRFYGEETEGGEIDALRLGRALVALTSLFNTAKALDPLLRKERLKVIVTGTEVGSFDLQIVLEGVGNAWEAVKAWTLSRDGQAATSLSTLLGAVLMLISMIKQSKGQTPIATEERADPPALVHRFPDGSELVMDLDTAKLYLDGKTARYARDLVETLNQEVNRLEIQTADRKVEVDEADRDAFRQRAAALGEAEDHPDERETTISPAKPDLVGKSTWSVTEHGLKYVAEMRDPRFSALVQEGWPVAVTDEYRVRVESASYTTPTGQRRARHAITEVLGFRRSPGQPFQTLPEPRTA